MIKFTHGSLFSGIGGFDLASEWMGWENIFHCEMNPFGKTILEHYWPSALSYDDITKTDFSLHKGKIDVLTGGFPCQPYSGAGKRKGKDDARHLWPEMLRAIREIQPRWVVGENVFGLTNWNGGVVFEEVCAELEAQGYSVQPFVLPACGVNAPHKRDRVWFVANAKNSRRGGWASEERSVRERKLLQGEREWSSMGSEVEGRSGERIYFHTGNSSESGWETFPTQSPICSGNDGVSYGLDRITFQKWRVESVKAYGNAIVPQVALEIFKTIIKFETEYGNARND